MWEAGAPEKGPGGPWEGLESLGGLEDIIQLRYRGGPVWPVPMK